MPENTTCLDLTISMPGLSSNNIHSSGEGGVKDLDINQIPSDDCMEEDEYESPTSGGGGSPPRKKLRLTKEQSRLLEESFRLNHALNPRQKEVLAMQLKLKQRQVEVWFQNRRARSKLKQTEMECEYLKRWYGSLTEQNRRLQKELEELRAMKVAPPETDNGSRRVASTLTMCPGCERVVAVDKGGSSAITTASVSPTVSAKGSIFQHRRHPSAANC